MSRLYLPWPASLWMRYQVNGVTLFPEVPPHLWPRDVCWLWIGGTNGPSKRRGTTVIRGGYGYVRVPHLGIMRAHEMTYALLRGKNGAPLHRHTCDVRLCGNPWHLIPGTPYQRGRR